MFLELFKLFFKNIMPLREEEYNFKSHHFNPLKVATIGIMIAAVVFSVVVLIGMGRLYDRVERTCPGALSSTSK